MNDLKRLEEDMAEAIHRIESVGLPATVPTIADRLIALGWTRLEDGETWTWTAEELDEERLARAIEFADAHEWDLGGAPKWAAAIAKAYREDA